MTSLLLALLIALQAVDLATTVYAITKYPQYASESNSIIAPLVDRIGVLPAMLLVKGAYSGFLIYLALSDGLPLDALVFMVVLYVALAAWNIRQILTARRWAAEKAKS